MVAHPPCKNGAMAETRKWFDTTQPQTLQGAVMLSYITAFFGILSLVGGAAIFAIVPLVIGVAGFGVANEKKWGYGLGVGLSAFNVIESAALLFIVGISALGTLSVLLSLLFAVILFVLYIHPHSREYQRIWFK